MKTSKFFQKLTKAVIDIGTKAIPYNTSYRPKNVYNTVIGADSFVAAENAVYREVFSSHQSNLDVHDPFYNLCSEGLRPHIISSIPAAFIVEIPKGRILQNSWGTSIAVVSQKNNLIGEISYQYDRPNVVASVHNHDIFRQQFFIKPTTYKGIVFSMLSGGAAGNNYFSWLFDSLPRLYLLKESGLFDKIDYFLVPGLQHKFHKEALRILGVNEKKLVACEGLLHIEADTLIVSSPIRYKGHIPAWVCEYHRKAFVKNETLQESDCPPLVYISRGDSKVRQVLNEPELISYLEGKGFKSFSLSKLPYEKQVKLFASAKVIVAAHGAGLTNLSFCKKDTSVVELYPAEYIKPTYQIISKGIGLDYHYIICKTDAAKQPKDVVKEGSLINLYADLQMLEKVLYQAGGSVLSPNFSSASDSNSETSLLFKAG